MRLRLAGILIWPLGAGRPSARRLLLSVLLQVYVVASPFYMQLMVDDAIAKNDHNLMTVLAVGFGLFLLVQYRRAGCCALWRWCICRRDWPSK